MNELYNKKLINVLKKNIRGKSNIKRFSNYDLPWTREAGWENKLEFDIFNVTCPSNERISIYASVGLSDFGESIDQKNRNEFITFFKNDTNFFELTGELEDRNIYSENLLMYLCCYSVNENDYLKPGDVWINWFSRYDEFNSELEHLFFVKSDVLFNNLSSKIEDYQVDWLICVPISQEELEFYEEHGAQALQELLIEHDVDISDLSRESLV